MKVRLIYVYLALITSLVPESCCCLFCRVAYIKLNNLCTSVELQSVCSEGRRSSETKRLAMHIDLILHISAHAFNFIPQITQTDGSTFQLRLTRAARAQATKGRWCSETRFLVEFWEDNFCRKKCSLNRFSLFAFSKVIIINDYKAEFFFFLISCGFLKF